MPPTLIDPAPGLRSVPITPLHKSALEGWLRQQSGHWTAWVEATSFKGDPCTVCLLPDGDCGLAAVLLGHSEPGEPWDFAGLPDSLPPGDYRLDSAAPAPLATAAALGWALGSYAFTRYKARTKPFARLVWPDNCDRAMVHRSAEAIALVRNLINTPAGDMGPEELAAEALDVAARYGASARVIVGEALLAENYPAIHAVGRASARAPRLVDFTWGDPGAPKVTLVGKGVCFDSGGLDLKSSSGMKLMKKDMGGAAQALGLARMIMDAGLPVRLRVLIPAVENSVSGNAMRPLDVLDTRKGLTVEIGNTDAEGRLILCDALAAAEADSPDLLVDFATLTGAARSALGTDLPALFCNDDPLADSILTAAAAEGDPLWRLPLWKGYRRMLDSKVADLNNAPDSPYAGAITAALFLQEFVGPSTPWAHIDFMAWNTSARPGRPEGGEAMGLRTFFCMIRDRFR